MPNAAAGRPRRANAGVNKSRHSMPGTTSNEYSRRYGTAPDGGDEDSDGEHTRTGPMTPAEKLAHRNKEKIKAKFRAVQNAVLKRSKRSTRGSRYSQVSSAGLTGQGATTKSPLPVSLFPPLFGPQAMGNFFGGFQSAPVGPNWPKYDQGPHCPPYWRPPTAG